MIPIGVGGVHEGFSETVLHPSVENGVPDVRRVFMGVAATPFIKCPGMRQLVLKRPGTGEVLRFLSLCFKRREVSPVTVLIPKGGDVGVRAHSSTGQYQNATGFIN